MKTKVTVEKFKCDRCGTTEERNIDKHSGVIYTLQATRCEDMRYGNSTTHTIDLCQKCSENFKVFISSTTPIKELQYYHDTTVGLWCTDRPEEIGSDLLFELQPIKEQL